MFKSKRYTMHRRVICHAYKSRASCLVPISIKHVSFTVVVIQPRLIASQPLNPSVVVFPVNHLISAFLCLATDDLWSSLSMASQGPYPSPPPSPAKTTVDPILRNALRYTISAKEYKTLHQYFITRSPPVVRKKAPPPPKYASLVQTGDDYNGAAIRASLRVFITAQTSLKLWELIKTNLLARGRSQRQVDSFA